MKSSHWLISIIKKSTLAVAIEVVEIVVVILVVQLFPVKPDGQMHIYDEPSPVAWQVAPFKHGLYEQAFVSS